jgi:hypothetical protein
MVKMNLFGWNDTGKVDFPESTVDYIKKNKEKDMLEAKSMHAAKH